MIKNVRSWFVIVLAVVMMGGCFRYASSIYPDDVLEPQKDIYMVGSALIRDSTLGLHRWRCRDIGGQETADRPEVRADPRSYAVALSRETTRRRTSYIHKARPMINMGEATSRRVGKSRHSR